ncbi:MAG TPA: TonB family protein [Casimicrobiaceae bacterium]|nr:TonB family protein [Casimicrobiaceae bacterium]
MPLDPSTLCARTTAGDAELAAPRHGLAIAQRRLLTLLDQPLPLDELAARPGLQPDRLERDLSRLAEHGLIEVHRPAGTTGPMFPPRRLSPAAVMVPPPPTPTASPALAGARRDASTGGSPPMRRVRRGRALLVGFLSLVAVGAAIWLVATPAPEHPRPPDAPSPAGTAAPGPVRNTSATLSTAASRPLEPVRALIDAPVAPERFAAVAPPARDTPGRTPPPVATPNVAAPPASALVVPDARPDPRRIEAVIGSPVTVTPPEPAALAPAPGAQPSAAPTPTTTPAPPVQLAAAAPARLDARPAARALVPLTREAPEFPREALNAGVVQGSVKARVSVDAAGRVTAVDILDAQPRRVFDRAVTRTLARWTFEPGDGGRTTDVEVAFKRD